MLWVFVFKQKTAYEMRISDWSSDVCSSDLGLARDAWARCVGVLERCQSINSANGRIVETKLHSVRTALDLLSGRDMASTTTYGPSGRTARTHNPLNIARA